MAECNICKQPLEPWEVTTCEPCGEILQDSSTASIDTNRKTKYTSRTGRKVQPDRQISKGLGR